MSEAPLTKVCTKCGVDKPLDEFYKSPGRYGRAPSCKSCQIAKAAARQKLIRPTELERVGCIHPDACILDSPSGCRECLMRRFSDYQQRVMSGVSAYQIRMSNDKGFDAFMERLMQEEERENENILALNPANPLQTATT